MHLANYLGLLHQAELELAKAFVEVAKAHGHEPDVHVLCLRFAEQGAGHAEALAPFVDRYGEDKPAEPERLHSELFGGTRSGGLGLLRDLHDLYLMATECEVTWALVGAGRTAGAGGRRLRVPSGGRRRGRGRCPGRPRPRSAPCGPP